MVYNISKPSQSLSGLVKHYWSMENCMPVGNEHIQRIVPNGLPELIFYLDERPVSDDRNKSITENSLVTGQLGDFYDIRVSGKLTLFSILFKPHGLSMFLNIPMGELYNMNIPLMYILKERVDQLENELSEADSFEERIQVAEAFLLSRLKKSENKYHFKRIDHCIHLINRAKGNINIDYLASETCFSRKQFERVFSDYVGTSPKQFLKTVRFQHAIDEKSKNKDANLTSLTYACGYYDQSHMTNDFYKLSGLTPKQYFNTCTPFSDYFQ